MDAGDRDQPGRPRRRRRAGRRELCARGRGAARLRPGRRRAADRLLRRLLDRGVQPHRAGAGRRAADGRGGRGAGQAARRPDDLPRRPDRPGAARGGLPVHRDVDRACACWPAWSSPRRRSRPAAPARPRPRSPTRRTPPRGRSSPRPASPSRPRSRSPTPPASRPPSTTVGLPVVLKATGRLHKSEGGGVVVGLADRDAARAAYRDLVARLARRPSRSRRWPTSPTGSS